MYGSRTLFTAAYSIDMYNNLTMYMRAHVKYLIFEGVILMLTKCVQMISY